MTQILLALNFWESSTFESAENSYFVHGIKNMYAQLAQNPLIPLKINFLVTPHISFLVARKHAESTAEVEAEFTGEEYTGDIPSAKLTSSGRQVKKPGRFIE